MQTPQDSRSLTRVLFKGEIQGLRAIAVLSVVAFHVGLPVSSGYLGVDYFFVISGFVISGVLIRELKETNRINLWEFYKRRFFRLIPALATMVFVTSILSFFLLSPLGMQQNTAKTGIGSLLLSANKVLSEISQGYFDLPAQTNPFLHTWSLSVEEQFYVVFPILLISISLIMKGRKRLIGHMFIIGILFTFSFLFFHFNDYFDIFGKNNWLQGFYSPIGRTWEFLLGVAAKALSIRGKSHYTSFVVKPIKNLLLILIVICVFLPEDFFRDSTLLLTVPIVGVCTLLLLGEKTDEQRLLASRFLKFIGDRSYSIYLWHWPFIVFSNYLFPNSSFSITSFFMFSFFIALASYKYIENPIRLSSKRSMINIFKISMVFVVPAILASGLLGYMSSEVLFKKYESGQIKGAYEGDIGAIGFKDFSTKNTSKCNLQEELDFRNIHKCDIEVLIVGDSHAQHLVPGFVESFPDVKFGSFGMELFSITDSSNGRLILDEVIKNEKIKIVVIGSYWHNNGVPSDLGYLIKSLSEAKKRIIVLDDVPNFPFDAFTCKFGFSQFISKNNCEIKASYFFKQRGSYFPALLKSVDNVRGAELLVISSQYCSESTCSMVKDGKLHYLDLNHLNVNGSKYIAKFIVANSNAFKNNNFSEDNVINKRVLTR